MVTKNSAWDILRSAILWNIWDQKCDKELNGNTLGLAKILFYSWQTTIHVGMAVWEDIHKHKRSRDRTETLIRLFEDIWTRESIFARAGHRPKWNLIPPSIFLPHNLASEKSQELDRILQRPASITSSSSRETLDEEQGAAIDDLFQDVLEDLALQADSPIFSTQIPTQEQPRETTTRSNDYEAGPSKPHNLIPIEELIQRCGPNYDFKDLVRDSSPTTAARLNESMRDEIMHL